MPGLTSSFRELYLRLDRRVLGVARIALGAVLLYDVARRFPDAALLWSDEGVLGPAAIRRMPQATPQVSFLLALSSAAAVRWAFAGLGLVFVLYGAGLFTRVMQVLALLGYASLNASNTFFEDGGTGCTILLLVYTLLLPLGDRFSLDALRRDANAASVRARVRLRAEARRPLYSLGLLLLLLQAALIYWLNAAHKTGSTWRGGDAVHLVLWQHRVNTPLALWFSGHEPAWLSPALTWLTKRTELLLPLLLLWPTHPLVTRSLSFVLALLLHGGIALSLTLGPFSYSMICLVWATVPGGALDWAASRVPARYFWRLARVRARLVRRLRGSLLAPGGRRPRAEPNAAARARLATLREVVLGAVLVVEASNLVASNRAFPKVLRFREPTWLLAYKPYLRGWQGWSMFAPDAPTDDGTLVVDALTRSGRHIDPFTGLAPDFEQIRRGLAPHSIALSDYFFAMRDKRNSRYRKQLARYFASYRAPGSGEGLRSAEIWWVSYVPPPRGSYEPGPLQKEKLWRLKL
ncbi:MAG: hypothetical protein EOO73_04290 [Myxococcales bacterium]|nr:MAG: hypothetical protein EOO73_04290 [Myxococcales bacterium]